MGLFWVSLHLVWCWLSVCCMLLFLYIGLKHEFLISLRLLTRMGVVFCQVLFQNVMKSSYGFLLWVCLYVCLYSELHWWISIYWTIPIFLDEAYLITVIDSFDVFLDLDSKIFIEYICIDIHKGNWSEIFFLCWVFLWFRYQYNCSFIERIEWIFLLFLSYERAWDV